MSKILVMGGTQFASKAIAKYLISKNHVVDIFTRGNLKVDYSGVNYHIKADRRDKNFIKNTPVNKIYDFVIDVSAYSAEDIKLLLINLNKKSLKKYIFISSGAVYNKQENENQAVFSENSPTKLITHPTWGDYGLNKKRSENYLKSQSKRDKIEFVIIRPPYIYGEGNNLQREQFYFSQIDSGKPLLIPANTKTQVQFIHIDDLCKFIDECLTNPKAKNEIYNISYPEIITWKNLLDSVMKVCKKKTKIYEIQDNIEPNARLYSPFRDENMVFDISKLIKHGFSHPVTTLDAGLTKAYNHFRNEHKNSSSEYFRDLKMTRLKEITVLMKKTK